MPGPGQAWPPWRAAAPPDNPHRYCGISAAAALEDVLYQIKLLG